MAKIFIPNPVQKQFIESRGPIDIFCSRMGEGKTTALVMACFYHTLQNPTANWAIIRGTWDDLEQTTLEEFMKWFSPFGTYYKSKKRFDWDPPLYGRVWFVPADDPADARRLQSRSLSGVAIDEAVPVSFRGGISEVVFDIAYGRLRQTGVKWRVAKVACNNPDKSHWLYKRFIENRVEGVNIFQPQNPENEHNLPEGYYDSLRLMWAHRPDLVQRYVEGKFAAIYEGYPVISVFKKEFIVEKPFDPTRTVYAFWDGGSHPACLIGQTDNDGNLHIHSECYESGIGIYELITRRFPPRYKDLNFEHIGDPTLSHIEQSQGRIYDVVNCASNTIINLLGGTFTPGAHGIEERIEPLRVALNDGLITVSPKCQALIEALSGAWYYDATSKPCKNHPYSDVGDCLAYGASVLFANRLRTVYDIPKVPKVTSLRKVGNSRRVFPGRGI